MNKQQNLQNPKLQRMLAYYEGGLHPLHHELAERLNAPLGTVKSRVRRGPSRLRECLES